MYASSYDLSSQQGKINLVIDDNNNAATVLFKSYKSKRVARSVLSVNVNSLADLSDDASALRVMMQEIMRHAVPAHRLTDSKSLIDIVAKWFLTLEKRVMVDICVAQQALKSFEISNIGLVRYSHYLASSRTKPLWRDHDLTSSRERNMK